MSVSTAPGSGTFPCGVHPPEGKSFAMDCPIEVLPTPKQIRIATQQNVGAPCEGLLKPRQEVTAGEQIGKAEAFISAPLHSPLTGVAAMAQAVTLANGRHMQAMVIKASEEPQPLEGRALLDDLYGGDWPIGALEQYAPEQIVDAVKTAGIVGQGGAAFPTYVKLLRNDDKPIDTVILNGCECEPYLTADYRMMVEFPTPILTGAILAARAVGASKIYVGIEDNKPLAIEEMQAAAAGTDVEIVPLKTKYPQGSEKQTMFAITGREAGPGKLPSEVGCCVINVATAAAIARAVVRNKPLTHRVVTVTGGGITNPKNLLVPVGVSCEELIDYCGGLTDDAERVISGGPMMGFTMGNIDSPVTKGTSGLTVLRKSDLAHNEETNCVRCGRCVDVCPMGLVPTRIALASRNQLWDLAKQYHILACVECGCCAYTCPAALPLVQLIRMGKVSMPRD